jgi:hypothetical protein
MGPASTSATIATGTLLHQTHCQPRVSVKRPPMSGPTANATPPTAPQMPSTRPCFSFGKASCRIAMVAGIKTAAPVPCNARPPMSCAAEPELATTTAARVYRTIPMMKMRLRPSTSPSWPPRTTKAATARR